MNRAQQIVISSALLIAQPVLGQQNNPAPPGGRIRIDDGVTAITSDSSDVAAVPKSERLKNKDLPQISVIDKLLAIESALGTKLNRSSEIQWVKDYNELYQRFREDGTPARIRGGGTNTACTAMALGVKACDAVLALKARNIEALKNASDQVEVLARKLGATQGEMGMANTVKIYANKGQWYNAFLALGRLQRDVLGYLRSNPEKSDLAVLVIVGGWMQGGRCVTHVVDRNYDDFVSNILREQRLVKLITENMEKLAPVHLNDPLVVEIMKTLPDIYKRVDVGLRDPVKLEDVRWLHRTFDDLVNKVTTSDVVAAPAPETPPAGTTGAAAASQPPEAPAAPQVVPSASPAQPDRGATLRHEEIMKEAASPQRLQTAASPPHAATAKPSAGIGILPVAGGVLLAAVGILLIARRKRNR